MTLCCNTSLLVIICLLLWSNDTINYGIIIYNETNEWNEPGILDVQPRTKPDDCPDGYQSFTGTYFGTNKICYDENSNQYNIGDCEAEHGPELITIEDVTESTIARFNGTYICYKKSTHNYHDLIKNRDKYVPQVSVATNTVQNDTNSTILPSAATD